MEEKLKEEFVVKDKTKKEYFEKIDAFLNQFNGFKPTYNDSTYKYLKVKDKDLFPLNENYFIKDNINLSTPYSQFILMHDNDKKRNVIVTNISINYTYGWHVIDETTYPHMNIQSLERLYRKIVLGTVSLSALIRQKKINDKEIKDRLKLKYQFNDKTKKGFIVNNQNKNGIYIKRFSINNGTLKIDKQPIFISFGANTYLQKRLKTIFLNGRMTNDFNELLPYINEAIKNSLTELDNKNQKIIESISKL